VRGGDLPQVQPVLAPEGQDRKNDVQVAADACVVGGRVGAAAPSAADSDPGLHLVGHGFGELSELGFDGLAVPGVCAGGVQAGQRRAGGCRALVVGCEQSALMQEEHDPVQRDAWLQRRECAHVSLGDGLLHARVGKETVQHLDGMGVVRLPACCGGKADSELFQQCPCLGAEWGQQAVWHRVDGPPVTRNRQQGALPGDGGIAGGQ
jgi:hypothetical protein